MRQLVAAALASTLLFGSVNRVDAAPGFSQTIHLNTAAINAATSAFVADMALLAVVRGPVQRDAPGLPRPTPPPTLPTPPPLHFGEVKGVPPPGAGNAVPGIPPAQIALPLRVQLPTSLSARSLFKGVQLKTVTLSLPGARSPKSKAAPNQKSVVVNGVAPTGINHWWTYEEGALTGIGKYMVNVATGNMVVQADDIDIPERGIDLAFRRTYNSLSQHDYANTDGSTPSLYGDGWTNTFDAHIANNSLNGISVFDIDGARYDYTPVQGNLNLWAPPPGQYGILFMDPAHNPGVVFWLKKNGTIYAFYLPTQQQSAAAYAGRLAAIFGRNVNNNIALTYYWDNNDSSNPYNLSRILVQHSDSHQLNLYFANYGTYRFLGSVQRPDGKFTTYNYWANASTLKSVYSIANNNATIAAGYSYTGTHLLQTISSPRWNASGGTNDGGWMSFSYNGNNTLSGISEDGVMNFVPADGTGVQLQSGYNNGTWMTYRLTSFTYGTNSTSLADTDGHNTIWTYDSLGRVTQTQEYTGSWLTTTQQWDASNNLIATINARANETDYAYDNNGNTIAVALPTLTTSGGTFRPTSLYSYDANNNVTAYCDPVRTNALGLNWTTRPGPSDTLCPSTSGSTIYTWDTSDANENYGRLSVAQTPLGYHTTFAYSTAGQGGDFGLPTSVTGDGFTQKDGSNWTPTQSFTYDGLGNLNTYNKGNGAWTLSYDTQNNRLTSVIDPDNVHSYKCYYPNGQMEGTTSAAQYNTDGVVCGAHSHIYTYDTDGNEITELKHFNDQSSLTNKWYDGAERLVEVAMPQDPNDYSASPQRDAYNFRWLTRYIYDLGQGAAQYFNGSVTLAGHGNLIKTQEWLANETQTWNSPFNPPGPMPQGTIHWQDIRGNSYDALDRSLKKVSWVNNGSPGTIQQWTSTYDANGYNGLLTSSCDPLSHCPSNTYDAADQLATITFGDSEVTHDRTYTYDPDSRVHSISSSGFISETYTYDNDGRMSSKAEGSGGSYTNPSTLNYSYYPNGVRSALAVSSANLNQTDMLKYIYRADGALTQELFQDGAESASFNFTYSAAGRKKTRIDNQYLGQATTYTYGYENEGQANATGRLYSLAIPQCSCTLFTYDSEDERKSAGGFGSTSYNIRGEIMGQVLGGGPAPRSVSANGFMINAQLQSGYSTPPTTVFDAYMGVLEGQYNDFQTQQQTGLTYTFDAAGRQTSGQDDFLQSGNVNSGYLTRGYDSENHIISSAYSGWPISGGSNSTWTLNFSYGWGPNGHPAQIGSNPNSGSLVNRKGTLKNKRAQNSSPISLDSLHWDGDTLLFTTNSSGAVDDVKIGMMADYTPLDANYKNVTFWDRNASGSVVARHNLNGVAPIQYPNWKRQVSNPCGIGPKLSMQYAGQSSIGQGGMLWSPGPDGYSDGDTVIQGTRSFDSNLGTWTTPDAYSGDVHDPMSQKPYMWNRNNSIVYTDPSGYCNEGTDGCMGGVDWNLMYNVVNRMLWVATFFIPVGGEVAAGAKLAAATGKVGSVVLEHAIESITDAKLGNIANQLFRAVDKIRGGTAGAVRYEASHPGELVGNKPHLEKAEQNIKALQNWLEANPNASDANKKAAQELLKDLQDAVEASKH